MSRLPLQRGMRPGEILRLYMDFSADVAKVAGDAGSVPTVTAADRAATNLTANCADVLLAANVVYVTYTATSADTQIVKFVLVTTSGKRYEHDMVIAVALDA